MNLFLIFFAVIFVFISTELMGRGHFFAEPMEEQVTALSPLHSNDVAEVTAETGAVKRKSTGSSNTNQGIKWYKQKFRDSWLQDERFKNWLVSVPNDPYRARCKLCNADLRAGKSELEKHARTKHHRDTVKAVEDVKALLGFANQAEAQALPEIVTDMQSADQSNHSFQVQEEELSRAVTAVVPRKRRSSPPPVASVPDIRCHLPPLGILPQVQCRAPDFKGIAVVDSQIREVQLSDYEGKFLLLFFYPQDFPLACPSELVEYSERAAEFRSLNTEILAISTDSYCTHLAWTNTPRKLGGLGKVNVPLMSDFTKKISKDYNVLLEDTGTALRASFIIDTKGMIRQVTINDVNLYRSVDETLRLLKALQYVEKHGSAICASWEPEPAGPRSSERTSARSKAEK